MTTSDIAPVRRGRILFVILLSLAMSMMAVSSVNVVLGAIQEGLGASGSDLQWLLSGYALVFGMSLIPSGRAGDLLGRGSWFVFGLVVFVVGALLCAMAPNPLVLNGGRLLQGLGAGLFNPQVTGMIQQYFSGHDRARAYALFGLTISGSVAVGPLVSGLLVQALGPDGGWRWSFLINVPFGLLAIVLALAWFPFTAERARKASGAQRKRLDVDPVGTLLIMGAVLCVMMPFMARTQEGWLLIPLALVLAWLWVRWERRVVEKGRAPLVDLRLFSFPSYSAGTLVTTVMFIGHAPMFALLALYLLRGGHATALEIGLIGLPNAVVSGIVAIMTGRYIIRHGRIMVIVGLSFMIVGTVMCIPTAFWMGTNFWWLALPLAIAGIGVGLMMTANQTLALIDVPAADSGTAGGVKATCERISIAIGNALLTAVFFATGGEGTWTTAFAAGFAVVTLAMSISLGLALSDIRRNGRGAVSPARSYK